MPRRASGCGGGTKPCAHNPTPMAKQKNAPAANPSRWITPRSTVPDEIDSAKNCKPAPFVTYAQAITTKNTDAANQQSPAAKNIIARAILLMV
jgi:hypothetical protein